MTWKCISIPDQRDDGIFKYVNIESFPVESTIHFKCAAFIKKTALLFITIRQIKT